MIARSPIKKHRPGPPRRGRVRDKAFLRWVAETQACLVSGARVGLTLHHVRRFGEQKSDRRIVALLPKYHMKEWGPESVEALGKVKFEVLHNVNLEAEILRLNAEYEMEKAA